MSDEEPIRVFLSYSSKDKEYAGQLKAELEERGLEAFLAHEDIEPTKEWEGVILENLKACDVFIPLLSVNFKESEWTDQETGVAVSEGKVIIPLKINVDPYGFIGKIQALKSSASIQDSCEKIFNILRKSPLFDRLRDTIIEIFVKSTSFEKAGENAESLKNIEPFSEDQINRIIKGFLENGQICYGFISSRIIRRLYRKYKEIIDPDLSKQFKAFKR